MSLKGSALRVVLVALCMVVGVHLIVFINEESDGSVGVRLAEMRARLMDGVSGNGNRSETLQFLSVSAGIPGTRVLWKGRGRGNDVNVTVVEYGPEGWRLGMPRVVVIESEVERGGLRCGGGVCVPVSVVPGVLAGGWPALEEEERVNGSEYRSVYVRVPVFGRVEGVPVRNVPEEWPPSVGRLPSGYPRNAWSPGELFGPGGFWARVGGVVWGCGVGGGK